MRQVFNIRSAIMTSLFMLGVYSQAAFANHADRTLSTQKQETENSSIRLQGMLICDLAAQNTGESCELKLKEDKSGRFYKIAQSDAPDQYRQAMKMYFSGKKNVVILGSVSNGEKIDIQKIDSL